MTEKHMMGKLECGVSVDVVRGTYKGDCGVVRNVTTKMCVVELQRAKEVVRIMKDSVQIRGDVVETRQIRVSCYCDGNCGKEKCPCENKVAVRKLIEQELRDIQARVDELVMLLERL